MSISIRRIMAFCAIGVSILGSGNEAFAQANGKVVVFAAASLATALNAIQPIFLKDTGKTVVFSYGSSGVLAKQIEQGAPADVFISADTKWIDYLQKKIFSRKAHAAIFWAMISFWSSRREAIRVLKIKPGFDLAKATADGKIAVCTIASCPAGIYAKDAFTKLGVWSAVEPKLAQANNVRDALALVARGEAKFGVVYKTDAKAEPKVRLVDVFPADSHAPIVYPVAVVASSKNTDAATFEAFLSSQAAVKILAGQGFKFLSKPSE